MEIVCTNLTKAVNDMKAFLQIAASNLIKEYGFKVHVKQMPADEDGFGCIIYYNSSIPTFDELDFRYNTALKKSPYISDVFSRFVHKERSYARGFSSVTLALLHEVGHYQTVKKVFVNNPGYNRGEAIFDIMLKTSIYKNQQEEANRLYQQLPDEKAATEWALDWLADAEHRKIAKAFERKFFANYEKRA